LGREIGPLIASWKLTVQFLCQANESFAINGLLWPPGGSPRQL
jgi:hypothetical protein